MLTTNAFITTRWKQKDKDGICKGLSKGDKVRLREEKNGKVLCYETKVLGRRVIICFKKYSPRPEAETPKESLFGSMSRIHFKCNYILSVSLCHSVIYGNIFCESEVLDFQHCSFKVESL